MLEVCVDNLENAVMARAAGADRIELCTCLSVGGVTPSPGLIREARKALDCTLVVLVRIRHGDFHYSTSEKNAMILDAQIARDHGADAVAVGSLVNGQIDLEFFQALSIQLEKFELVVHRAFDTWIKGRHLTFEQAKKAFIALADLGYRRVLTGGGFDKAIDGLSNLKTFVQAGSGCMEILPAGGIQAENAATILHGCQANQLHGSFRRLDGRLNVDAIRAVRSLLPH